jgi:hypothetical protein
MKRIGLFFAVMFVLSAAVNAQVISITLSGAEQGWLNCPEAGVSTRTWFRSTETTPGLSGRPWFTDGVYTAEVSWMESKGVPGIIIYGGPNNIGKERGLFIHVGSRPGDSVGCFVITRAEMNKLYNTLEDNYGRNKPFRIRIE